MPDIFDVNFSRNLIAVRERGIDVKKSTGYQRFKELLNLKIPFFIFRRNYIDWEKAIEEYYSDDLNLHSNSIKRWYRQKVLITKTHNLLSSARACVELYEKKHIHDSFHCFMNELRNYVTHVEYLPLTSKLTANSNGLNKFETFQVDGFMAYLMNQIDKHPKRNGSKLAKEFIESTETPINLNHLFKKYYDKLTDLSISLIQNHIKKYSTELAVLADTTKSIHNNLEEIGVKDDFPLSRARLRYLKYLLSSHNNKI